jgi:hypothetical protein
MLGLIVLKFIADIRYELERTGGPDVHPVLTLFMSLLVLAVFLPQLSWLAVWISLKTRTRYRAVLIALGVAVAWNLVPWVLIGFVATTVGPSEFWPFYGTLACVSPTTMIALAHSGGLIRYMDAGSPAPLVIGLMIHAAALFGLRTLCLAKADGYLGRSRGREPGGLVPVVGGAP